MKYKHTRKDVADRISHLKRPLPNLYYWSDDTSRWVVDPNYRTLMYINRDLYHLTNYLLEKKKPDPKPTKK